MLHLCKQFHHYLDWARICMIMPWSLLQFVFRGETWIALFVVLNKSRRLAQRTSDFLVESAAKFFCITVRSWSILRAAVQRCDVC
mmetsp:Transcript_7014/g.18803  ORF Transcript_7014/g.18803 Transcript_7014/m.18803 type:complete len:85 (+) Transcript_7014:431-685(+)